MNQNLNNYPAYFELIEKLDEFIRKYYKNQLIRGGIYAFTAVLAFYLSVTLLESFAWFNTGIRSVLFYAFVGSTLFILYKWVLIPLRHLYKMGKIISHNEAASIIGQHFSSVSDKLLNTLQLKEQADSAKEDLDLVYAGINQKSAELRPISFASAIDLSGNRKYLRYAALPMAVLLFILIASPSLLKESTTRLINHGTSFSRPAPFKFNIENKNLKVVQNEDFLLNIKLTGSEIPEEVFIIYNDNQFKLDKENKIKFAYTFKNIQKTTSFKLTADGFSSIEYILEALPNPVVTNFEMELKYPAYLQKKAETIKNTGDLLVPAGTVVKWSFNTENTETLKLFFLDTSFTLAGDDSKSFTITRRLLKNNQYSVRTSNAVLQSKDSMHYMVNVIPDAYPSIDVEKQEDSASYQHYYFRGLIKDDYGFSKLHFTYRFIKRDSIPKDSKDIYTEAIAVGRGVQQEQFFYYWDLSRIGIQPGDEVEYYFEVWDNDGVTGAKSSRSQSDIYKAPTLNELAKDADKKNDALKKDLLSGMKQSKKLQKDINDIHKELLNKKSLEYEDRKKISDILEQQKNLEQKVDDIKKQSQENSQKQNEFRNPNEELAEKQKQLQEMFDKMMSPEMKKMVEELQKMLSEMDKSKLQEAMDKMKLDNKDLEKEMDRTLELFKAMELEQKMKEAADQLDKLAEKQEKLNEETKEKKSDAADLEKKQEELAQEMKDLKEQLEDIDKKNSEMENPENLPDMKEDAKEVEKDMQDSKSELNKGNKPKSGKSQEKAADKLRQMAATMQNQIKKNEEEQQEEDMNALRALLENLLHFSFEQEGLMQDLKTMDVNNPRFLKLSQQQRKLKDDARMLEDSLLALSKRVMQIQSAVNEHLTDINDNIEKSIDNLQERMVPSARVNQQYVMTAANDLALMLAESLDQMQQQMQSEKPGEGKCKKPGKGKGKPGPTASDVKKMQEKLSQQLKEMKEKMGKGKDGKDKPGEKGKGKEGEGGMSEELAKMAAQQEAIRNALKELESEQGKDGGQGKLGKTMQQMEENEKDIVNKRITDATLKRQEEIMTRLLESEKAEREREQEERRESNEAKTDIYRSPARFEEYKRLKMRELELLKTIPPSLTTFYKNLVNSYFQSLDN